jgi:serine protease Do
MRKSRIKILSGTKALILLVALALVLPPRFACSQPAVGPAVRELQESFREIAKQVKPAVVNISTAKNIAARNSPDLDPFIENFRQFFGDEFMKQFFRFRDGSQNYRQQGLGSGFIVDPRGYIITSRHVVNGADEILVTLESGKKFKARLILADPKTDVAIIKIDGGNFPYARLGDSNTLQVGDLVLAIGNPFGLTQTVTRGIVSAVGRHETALLGHQNFIQTDAAINPGNSGGPLVNIYGQVVGINAAILSKSGGYMGIGFAIPINVAKSVFDRSLGRSAQRAPVPRTGHPLTKRASPL